jgi:hypothetical protein
LFGARVAAWGAGVDGGSFLAKHCGSHRGGDRSNPLTTTAVGARPPRTRRPSAFAAAEIRTAKAAGITHQVHGAIGFTYEYSLHRRTRRLWTWRGEFGTQSHWSSEIGRAVRGAGADALWPTITGG